MFTQNGGICTGNCADPAFGDFLLASCDRAVEACISYSRVKEIMRYFDDYIVVCRAQPGTHDSIDNHVVRNSGRIPVVHVHSRIPGDIGFS